nr:hypothetical protein [Tanacetum cinerariifolium]
AKPTEKHLKEVKRIFRYLRGIVNTSLWYTKDSGLELTGFSKADYAGCKDTFKSTSKAEYVSLSAYCAQVLWMRTQLTDYGFHFNKIPIYYDSKSAIAISCNPTDYQLADLFTKALPADRFNYLVRRLGMRSLSPQELDRLAKSQGRLLESFQDLEHEGGDTRSQGGIRFRDIDIKIKIQDHKHANGSSKGIPKNTRLLDSRRLKKDSLLNDHPLGGDC